jgi:hypothetical protein
MRTVEVSFSGNNSYKRFRVLKQAWAKEKETKNLHRKHPLMTLKQVLESSLTITRLIKTLLKKPILKKKSIQRT